MQSNPAYSHVTVVSIGYLIAVLVLATNGLLFLSLLCDRLSRQSTFGLYVINICVANFLYGCLSIVQLLPTSLATAMGLNHSTCVYIAATLELLPAVTVLTLFVLLIGHLHFLLIGGQEVMKDNQRMRCVFGLVGVWFTWILATLVVMPLRMNDGPPPLTPSQAHPGHGVTYFGGRLAGWTASNVTGDRMSYVNVNDVRFAKFTDGREEKGLAEPLVLHTSLSNLSADLKAGLRESVHKPLQRRSRDVSAVEASEKTRRKHPQVGVAPSRATRSAKGGGGAMRTHRHEIDIEDEVANFFTHGYFPSNKVHLPASSLEPLKDSQTQSTVSQPSAASSKQGRGGNGGAGAAWSAPRPPLARSAAVSGAEPSHGAGLGGVGICSSDLLPSHPKKAAVSLVTVFPPTLALLCLSLTLLALLLCSPDASHPKHAKRRRHGNQNALRWAWLSEDAKREVVALVAVCMTSVLLRLPREVARVLESVRGGGHSQPPYLVLLEMLSASQAALQPVLWLAVLPAARRALRGLCCRGGATPAQGGPARALPLETSV